MQLRRTEQRVNEQCDIYRDDHKDYGFLVYVSEFRYWQLINDKLNRLQNFREHIQVKIVFSRVRANNAISSSCTC